MAAVWLEYGKSEEGRGMGVFDLPIEVLVLQ